MAMMIWNFIMVRVVIVCEIQRYIIIIIKEGMIRKNEERTTKEFSRHKEI